MDFENLQHFYITLLLMVQGTLPIKTQTILILHTEFKKIRPLVLWNLLVSLANHL